MAENTGRDSLDSWGVGPVHGATSSGRGWWQGEPLLAGDIMTTHVTTVNPQTALIQVAEVMRRESVGVVPVVDGQGRLIGIVTDRDIVVRGCVSPRPVAQQTAGDVMTTEVECARSDETLVRALERMARRGVSRLPVLEGHHRREAKLVGLISFDDLAARAVDDPELAEAMERLAQQRRKVAERPPEPHDRTRFLLSLWRRLHG
jgi:CBS domain-containing protein